jgi:hypothetical protein
MSQGGLSTFPLYNQVSGLDAWRETMDVLEWNITRARGMKQLPWAQIMRWRIDQS